MTCITNAQTLHTAADAQPQQQPAASPNVSRRVLLATCAAAATVTPTIGASAGVGPIEAGLREMEARDEHLIATKGDRDITNAESDWADEPLYEALENHPETAREWAALAILALGGGGLHYDASEALLAAAEREIKTQLPT